VYIVSGEDLKSMIHDLESHLMTKDEWSGKQKVKTLKFPNSFYHPINFEHNLINQVKQINQQVFSQDHHVSSFRKRSSVK
jgi:hypothetical protein